MCVRKIAILFLVVAVACATSSCTAWGEKKKPTWKSATSGEQLENLFWQDVKAKNWKSLESRMAPIMIAMNASAVFDRAGTLEHLKGMHIETFQIGELRTEPAGEDLIVAYVITVRGTASGQSLPTAPIRMMSVWQHVRGGYILVAHTSIPTGR